MPAIDALSGYTVGPEAPADDAASVTPHDTTELAYITRGLYVGTAGDVTVVMAGSGTDITFKAVPAGTILPIRVKIVKDTGTTQAAGDIIALW